MVDRQRSNDREREPDDGDAPAADMWVSSLGQGDAMVSLPDVVEGEPFGGGEVLDMPAGTGSAVARWSVPVNRQAELDEVAVASDSATTVRVDFHGLTFGPYSDGDDVTIPFDGATLIGGSEVVVRATSTASEDHSAKAQLTGRLF